MKILIINGPNLNLLHKRDNKIYGDISLAEIERKCLKIAQDYDMAIKFVQSNDEGEIVAKIQLECTRGRPAFRSLGLLNTGCVPWASCATALHGLSKCAVVQHRVAGGVRQALPGEGWAFAGARRNTLFPVAPGVIFILPHCPTIAY